MFTGQRGEWVELTIATTSGVVGAVPRMGKTYFLRELALVAALDPRTEEYIFELKGTGDLSCTKKFAHYYSDEEEDIADHLVVMRKLQSERRRRAKVIRSLPDEQCPRSEVTDKLASRRELGLHPILVEVDECQVWFEHPVKEIRDELIRIVEDLVRRGPAVGIMVYLATQRVDVKSIPSGISANASVRVCFKVNDATSNNQILGPGSYANRLQATMFDFVRDKGIAYLKTDGPGQIVRTVFALDKIESDKVALRARAARERAGCELQAGLDRRDADMYNRHFAEDVIWGSPYGAVIHGYKALHAIHARFNSLPEQPGGPRSRYEVVQVTTPAPGIALAHVRRQALNPDGKPVNPTAEPTGAFSEMALYVLVHRKRTWWLAAGQNTLGGWCLTVCLGV
jgi:uncharacterized protein (TIGR02246 family)